MADSIVLLVNASAVVHRRVFVCSGGVGRRDHARRAGRADAKVSVCVLLLVLVR